MPSLLLSDEDLSSRLDLRDWRISSGIGSKSAIKVANLLFLLNRKRGNVEQHTRHDRRRGPLAKD